MSVDWEQRRLDRQRSQEDQAFDAKAKRQIEQDKISYLKAKETEQHRQELSAYAALATSRASEASKRGIPDVERVWSLAASHARAGKWLVHRTVSADCRIPQFQSLRSRLCCDGQTAQIEEK